MALKRVEFLQGHIEKKCMKILRKSQFCVEAFLRSVNSSLLKLWSPGIGSFTMRDAFLLKEILKFFFC